MEGEDLEETLENGQLGNSSFDGDLMEFHDDEGFVGSGTAAAPATGTVSEGMYVNMDAEQSLI